MAKGFFTDAGDAGNVGDGAGVHVAGILVGLADANDVEAVVFSLAGDDGFDELGTNVEGKNSAIGGFRRDVIGIMSGGSIRGFRRRTIRAVVIGSFDGFSGGLNFRFG